MALFTMASGLFSLASSLFTAFWLRDISTIILWSEIFIVSTLFGAALLTFGSRNIIRHDASVFDRLGCQLAGISPKGSHQIRLRRFKAHFGVTPDVAAALWARLAESGWLFFAGIRGPKPEHLLWCLFWLKGYPTEELCASEFKVGEKNLRKWVWFYLEGIARLDRKIVSHFSIPFRPFLFRPVVHDPIVLEGNRSLLLLPLHLSSTDPLERSVDQPWWRALPCYY